MIGIKQGDSPLVTVLLPVRNGRETLVVALQSIVSQTLASMEVLVLDDGSTDGSGEIVARFDDPRLRLVSDGRHKGLATRLNEGIDLARGKYIARMDADDVAFPERLQRQYEYLERHPQVDLLGTRAIVFRSQDEVIGLLPFKASHEQICASPWRGVPLPHPTWMGKSAWFRTHRYRMPEVLRAEDQELLIRAAPSSCYACLDDVLLGYRQHGFSLPKILLARRHLLRAQLGLFTTRGEWANAGRALSMGILKMVVDLLCSLPGGKRLFFARMANAYEPAHLQELQKILQIGK
jgi:glycosyltransferase involved in cell wall biosynthesis